MQLGHAHEGLDGSRVLPGALCEPRNTVQSPGQKRQ
jgi:hypothetical protein